VHVNTSSPIVMTSIFTSLGFIFFSRERKNTRNFLSHFQLFTSSISET
jgi:hypothetical protein